MEPMVSVKNVGMRFNMATESGLTTLKEYVIKFLRAICSLKNFGL